MTRGGSPWRALASAPVHRYKRPYEVETRTREGSDNLAREGQESPSFMAGRMSMLGLEINLFKLHHHPKKEVVVDSPYLILLQSHM